MVPSSLPTRLFILPSLPSFLVYQTDLLYLMYLIYRTYLIYLTDPPSYRPNYLPISLPINLPVYLSIYTSIDWSTDRSICPSIWADLSKPKYTTSRSINQSINLSTYPAFHLSDLISLPNLFGHCGYQSYPMCLTYLLHLPYLTCPLFLIYLSFLYFL